MPKCPPTPTKSATFSAGPAIHPPTSHALPPRQPKEQPAEVSDLALRMDAAVELQSDIEAVENEFTTRPGIGTLGNSDDELATWYLATQQQLDDRIAMIRAQSEAMIRACENRKRGLAWRFGGDFHRIIDDKLHSQGGKKKSVVLLTGRAGYRTAPGKTQIVDASKAIEWAEFSCPGAIRRTLSLTAVKEHIKETGEIPPGVIHNNPRESFYPNISIHELPRGDNDGFQKDRLRELPE